MGGGPVCCGIYSLHNSGQSDRHGGRIAIDSLSWIGENVEAMASRVYLTTETICASVDPAQEHRCAVEMQTGIANSASGPVV